MFEVAVEEELIYQVLVVDEPTILDMGEVGYALLTFADVSEYGFQFTRPPST